MKYFSMKKRQNPCQDAPLAVLPLGTLTTLDFNLFGF